ncbi:MAG: hypothetical protein KDA58_16345 [Planctomycetaceae bacterium]|nr:hypothetical protein [Planctomycetaceae bacterium]
MTIQVNCPSCGKTYKLKPEFAGRRFKCKACESPVQVPASMEDEDDDLFGDLDAGAGETMAEPLPTKRSRKPKSKGKSRKKSGGSNPLMLLLYVAIGVVALGVAGVVGLGVIGMVAKMNATPEWREYTTPDGAVTVQMPGEVKNVKIGMAAPGAQSLGVDTGFYACVVVIEPVPPQAIGIDEDELIGAMSQGMQSVPGVSGVSRMDVAGRPGVTFSRDLGSLHSEARAIKVGDKFYTFSYCYRRTPDEETRRTFFDSVRANR